MNTNEIQIMKVKPDEILSRKEIDNIAKETGFLQRTRIICPFDFLMVLIFRFAASYPPALRLMVSLLEIDISRSGLSQRFTEKAAAFVRRCLHEIILKQSMKEQPVRTIIFHNFKRILISDSSGWDVSPHLKEIYTGSGGSASTANCKLQLCYDYKTGSVIFLEDTKGTEPDQKYGKQIINFVNENDLILRDLGYSSYETFSDIHHKKAYFCSRFLTASDIWQPEEKQFVRLNLENLLKSQPDGSIELNVFLKGKKEGDYLPVRLIAFRVPEEAGNLRRNKLYRQAAKKGRTCSPKNLYFCNWSIFITNASESLIPAKMIRTIYRIRWSIELIFKNWKSVLKIQTSNVKKNHCRLQCELYAKLILAVMVHSVHQKAQLYVWSAQKNEISFISLWKYIVARAESLHKAVKRSVPEYLGIINSLFPSIIKTCQKYHQPSRKTTLQLIDEMVGDIQPVKIISENGLT